MGRRWSQQNRMIQVIGFGQTDHFYFSYEFVKVWKTFSTTAAAATTATAAVATAAAAASDAAT